VRGYLSWSGSNSAIIIPYASEPETIPPSGASVSGKIPDVRWVCVEDRRVDDGGGEIGSIDAGMFPVGDEEIELGTLLCRAFPGEPYRSDIHSKLSRGLVQSGFMLGPGNAASRSRREDQGGLSEAIRPGTTPDRALESASQPA
jgi:hypothetical protein